ncbi:carbon-nitrogen hydrolase family protein [Metabacillus litoralis]|uniref:carbon-nitrogen hydrolase family protein n=1 Tax=Metabacillus litoralis TaxID=152268 RepID=UPI000EF55E93|nr:carbon-nitrogen hydrolase family protein [Metabacillus litoralis]
MKISLGQFQPKLQDKQFNMVKIKKMMEEGKKQQSNLILFPEMSLTGYLLEDSTKLFAEEVTGTSITELREHCRKLGVDIIISFPEKEMQHYFITAIYIDSSGKIKGKYRKTHLFHTESNYFTKGQDYHVFDTQWGKVGIMICYDLEFPEVARLLRMKGADFICVPTANMKPYEKYQEVYVKSRAMENEIPVIICNRIGQEGNLDFFGNSMVVDHEGQVLMDVKGNESLQTCRLTLSNNRDPKLKYINNINPTIYSQLQELKETKK